MSSEKEQIDNIGDLSFDLVFEEEPLTTLSSTKEEKVKIEKKIEKKQLFMNRFKEKKEFNNHQNSR